MTFTPAGPPEDPQAMLVTNIVTDSFTLKATAIAVTPGRHNDLLAHPNQQRLLNDLYLIGTPRPLYEQNGRTYIVFGHT
jgi:hypothetical protein